MTVKIIKEKPIIQMKNFLMFLVLCLLNPCVFAGAITGTFRVAGDPGKFYPVIFADGGWNDNSPTELILARSNVHTDKDWLGSLISKFTFHTSAGGHKANFINAEIAQSYTVFVAGWKDITTNNNEKRIIIWVKGGDITYCYNSNYQVDPIVYDGVSNSLIYTESDAYNPAGVIHTFKVSVDPYVNSQGISNNGSVYYAGNEPSYFKGSLGIGTLDTKGYKFAVAGDMIVESIRVKLQNTWPDYVFSEEYKLPSLSDTHKFILKNGHLPDIPSAAVVKAEGFDLADMNIKLLKKIEELTLHLIEQDVNFKTRIEAQEAKIRLLTERLSSVEYHK